MKAPHCERPPRGWKCLKEPGHSGPCPGMPTGLNRLKVWLQMRNA